MSYDETQAQEKEPRPFCVRHIMYEKPCDLCAEELALRRKQDELAQHRAKETKRVKPAFIRPHFRSGRR